MTNEQEKAFMVLQVKSCGLEETFLSASRDLVLSEDDADYARDACEEILNALTVIEGKG